jgi:hypothetical protein
MKPGWRLSGLVAAALVSNAAAAHAQYARVSVADDGAQANGASGAPSISRDGRFVAFASSATNLVAGDQADAVADCYLHDRDVDADGVFDEPGAIATRKVSQFAGGTDVPGACERPVVAGSGGFVYFFTRQLNTSEPAFGPRHLIQWNRATGALTMIDLTPSGAPAQGDANDVAVSDDGQRVVFTSLLLDTVDPPQALSVFLRDLTAGTLQALSEPFRPLPLASISGSWQPQTLSISGDGRYVAWVDRFTRLVFAAGPPASGLVRLADLTTGVSRTVTGATSVRISDDGAWLLLDRVAGFTGSTLERYGLLSGEQRTVGSHGVDVIPVTLSRDGRYVITQSAFVDAQFEQSSALPLTMADAAALDGASRYLAAASPDTTLLPGGVDTNGVADIYVVDLPTVFDADTDGLDDRWERFFGLSPSTATGADGPAGDPDSDGLTNAQEQSAGSHPRGLHRRYLAEGATGTFFRTYIAVANPGSTPAVAVATFSRSDGHLGHAAFPVLSLRRRTLAPADLPDFASADFSTVIESDQPLVVDRTMRWDTRSVFTPGNGIVPTTGYGAHSESAVEGPATRWFLAEGSTVIDFDLFYLLQNPQSTAVDATVRYLRPSGAPVVRTYTLAPHSRTTIYVNNVDPALADSDVSGDISATAPIIVERSMYASRPGQLFALGHASRGVTDASVNWFLAEGATGTFFDTYVLIANPQSTTANLDVRFDKPDGTSVTRQYQAGPNSRFTIFVDAIAGLEATSVSTTVTSTNAVPVIVERAMYWPSGFFDYYEGHSSPGVTSAGLRWALAEGESDLTAASESFILIANTAPTPGRVRITPMLEQVLPSPYEIDLPPLSRTTISIGQRGGVGRMGTLVESVGATPVPIVVEGAFYWTVDDVLWAAGSNVVATKLP